MKNANPILALDPSSTKTGYAVMRGLGTNDLIESGIIKPPKPRGVWRQRVKYMARQAVSLIDEHHPAVVLIEGPSRHLHRRAGRPVNFGVYARAVEMIRTHIESFRPECAILEVESDVWNRQRPKTAARTRGGRISTQEMVALKYPAYRAAMNRDRGADCADAIGMGIYYYEDLCNERQGTNH